MSTAVPKQQPRRVRAVGDHDGEHVDQRDVKQVIEHRYPAEYFQGPGDASRWPLEEWQKQDRRSERHEQEEQGCRILGRVHE